MVVVVGMMMMTTKTTLLLLLLLMMMMVVTTTTTTTKIMMIMVMIMISMVVHLQDFRPAMAMFVFSLFCHVLASFYAFLRHDFFHAVQFAVYFVFWMSRGVLQLLVTLDGFNGDTFVTQRVNFFGQWSVVILLLVITFCSLIFARVSLGLLECHQQCKERK
jgi:hypothetical protein